MAQLKESTWILNEEELLKVFAQLPAAIIVFGGKDHKVEFVNDLFSELFERRKQELLGKTAREIIPPDRLQKLVEVLDNIRQTGKPLQLHENKTLVDKKKKKETAFLNIAFQPIIEKDGIINRIMLVCTDVTQEVTARNKAEQSQKKIEEDIELLRIALEGGELGYYDYYPQSGELIWSRRTKEMFGLPPEAEVDYSIYLKALHPGDRKRMDAAVQNALQFKNGIYEGEYRAIGITDGKTRWVRSKGKLFYDENGKAIRFIGITQDITRQKTAEEKIRNSEARYRQIFEGTPVSIWEKDFSKVYVELKNLEEIHGDGLKYYLEHNQNEVEKLMSLVKIKDTNETSVKMFEADNKEQLLRGLSVVFTKESIPFFIDELMAIAERRESFESEYILQTLKGRKIYCLVKTRLPKNENYNSVLVSRFDITDRKQAEQALKESEEFSRAILESSPDCIKIIDPKGRLQYINFNGQGHLEIDDFSQVANQCWWQLWDEDKRPMIKGAVEKALKGERVQFQGAAKTAKGTLKWWDVLVSPIYETNGDKHPKRLIAVSRDITEQKNADEKIRQSEIRYRQIFEETPVSIWDEDFAEVYEALIKLKELHGAKLKAYLNANRQEAYRLMSLVKIKDTNKVSLQMFDAKNIEELKAGLHLVFTEETVPVFIDELIAMIEKQEIFEGEFPMRTLKGRRIYCHVKIKFPSNDNYSTVLISRFDITSQKLAEEALRQSEEELRVMANSIQNLVWIADGEGRVFWFNKRWYEYTGTELKNVRGKGWQKLVHPDYMKRLEGFINEALKKDEPFELVFPLRKHNGQYLWFLTRVFPLKNAEGKVYRWIGTNTDIDEQKSQEEKLEKMVNERTRELQRSNEDLQQFAHVASHDLKEPVRKIRTFASRLTEEFKTTLPEKAMLYLDKINKSGERIYQMIEGVLLYSSLNAMEQSKERVNLDQIFNQLLVDFEILIHEKDAKIQWSNLPTICGSSILIYQLFYNLLNNALKFTKPGEKPLIKVECSKEEIEGRNILKITMQDNGIGFRQQDAQKIFQTFTRLNPKDKFEGTGLGLSLCEKIVERHGGTISAEGKEGKGAGFIISFPIEILASKNDTPKNETCPNS